MLTVKDLHKTYKSGVKDVKAVNGISLEIREGKSIAIVGPSGAGKSTLLHIMGGLDRPTSGKILLGDVDLYKLSDRGRARIRNKNIGFVFQFYHLLPEFTALENVVMPMLIRGQGPGSRAQGQEMRKRAKCLLASVGLEHRLDHLPSRLAGGECQRVAIARALMNEPQILLCDEPTGNLDSKNSEMIYDLLFNIKEKNKTTIIIVSHDEKLASRVDEAIRLKDGKLA